MAKKRAGRDTRESIIYHAHFDTEPPVIYDYHTGLPVAEAAVDKFPQPQQQDEPSVPSPLPVPGEFIQSIDDPPPPAENHTRVIIVEIG